MTKYTKEADDILLASTALPTGGTLCRYFNFSAAQVTTIFVQETKMREREKSGYSSDSPIAISMAAALTSQMQIQPFSSFDSTLEIEKMHKELVELKGNPPPLSEQLTGKIDKPHR